jgi:Protein kinase domain
MTSESRRSNRGAVPAGTPAAFPQGASTTMTLPATPPPLTATAACPAQPTTPPASLPRHRPATIHSVAPSRRSHPIVVDASATAAEPVRHHADLMAGHPDRATLPIPAAPRPADPQRPVDAWPLRGTDPVSVDGYRLVSRLGAGGMADVFHAVAPTGGPVAVKLLRAAAGAPRTCQREYRLAQAVDADCTAPALGHGLSTAGAYLVTAYLPGYRSGTTLVGRSMSGGRLWTLGSTLARVLAAVHARGVVHCDVKPSNLLVRDHDVRLIDFGISRYVGERCGSDGTVQCTRGWAAPEQLRTAPATPAVDIFAWGCLLAYLDGGVHPFASHSEQEWILRIQSAQPDLSGVPPDLAEVIR